jgi:hypothetical protein
MILRLTFIIPRYEDNYNLGMNTNFFIQIKESCLIERYK